MDWSDEGIVLTARPHGETSAVVTLLTREHGRHAGLVRGGRARRTVSVLETGNRVEAVWRARLEDQLGWFTLELERHSAAPVLGDPPRLTGLAAACAVADAACPDREPAPGVFEGLDALLALLAESPYWAEAYVRWELALLAALGYGLDLDRCAATGTKEGLAYVSPRSGRAVSSSAGEPYRDKLLPLPGFLVGHGGGGPSELAAGLQLTGYFLERRLLAAGHVPLPPARARLAALFPWRYNHLGTDESKGGASS